MGNRQGLHLSSNRSPRHRVVVRRSAGAGTLAVEGGVFAEGGDAEVDPLQLAEAAKQLRAAQEADDGHLYSLEDTQVGACESVGQHVGQRVETKCCHGRLLGCLRKHYHHASEVLCVLD